MNKRVLIFSTDDFVPPAGGAEIAIGEIVKRMPEKYEFDLFCARISSQRPKEEKIGQTTIYRLGWGIPFLDKMVLMFFGHYFAKRIHKKKPYNLVWAMMASYGAFSAVKFKKQTGVPYLLTLQEGDDLDAIENKVWFLKNSFRRIFSEADALQPISNFLLRWGLKMGYRSAVSDVIPNGVDIGNFSKETEKKDIASIRESWGFPNDAKILVTSSRLELKNGIGDVIKALPLLPENVCFVICGFGSLENDLKKMVSDLSLEKRVRFLGLTTHDYLPQIFKASDIFIRPSLTEGLGNAFLEAMAARLPVVGTAVGGIPDFLIEESTGFLCKPSDPGSIAACINKIIKFEQTKLSEIIERAFNLVCDKYNWDKISGQMASLFDKIIEHKKSKPVFILSLDTELAWGTRGDKYFLADYLKTRDVIKALLDLFGKYDIHATWAIVGHLFLDNCKAVNGVKHPEINVGSNTSHFSIDPASDITVNPEWYGKDIVELIKNYPCPQEIGCHTFSHIVADEGCSEEFFDSELKASKNLAEKTGVKLKSFVFPKNIIGFVHKLRENGFVCFRGKDSNWYRNLPKRMKKFAHLLDNYLAIPAPAVVPDKAYGLWNLPGSYFYVHSRGWAKYLPVSFRVRKCKLGIDRAVKEGKVFHLWFHPFNIASNPDALLGGLEQILSFVSEKRKRGELATLSMSDAAEYFETNL